MAVGTYHDKIFDACGCTLLVVSRQRNIMMNFGVIGVRTIDLRKIEITDGARQAAAVPFTMTVSSVLPERWPAFS
jgi:hypothetical protein